MPTINSTLSLAKQALLAQQGAMGTASDNVANVNTAGYTRRRAILESSPSLQTVQGRFGQGVQIESIQAIRDHFLDAQLRDAMGDSGWFETGHEQLHMAEEIMSDLGQDGLGNALDKFWNSWHDLAADPSSLGARYNVVERAEALANRFNNIDERLQRQMDSIDGTIKGKVARVNVLAEQLADLNVEFTTSRGGADLEDRRNVLLDELSQLTGSTYQFSKSGSVTVHLDGNILVMHDQVNKLTTDSDGNNPVAVYALDVNDTPLDMSNGEIGALFNVRDGDIGDLRERLDEVARTLAEQVNNVHRDGYTLTGSTGVSFFANGVTGMSDFALSAAIMDDPANIAASGDGTAGDNTIALRIAELEHTNVMSGGTESIADAYQSVSSWFGAVVSEAEISAEGSQLALAQAQSWRDSVSAVSLDEEMAELIRFQHAFNAAAKVVGGVNKMLEAVINIG